MSQIQNRTHASSEHTWLCYPPEPTSWASKRGPRYFSSHVKFCPSYATNRPNYSAWSDALIATAAAAATTKPWKPTVRKRIKCRQSQLLHPLAGIWVYIWIQTNLTLFRCCITTYCFIINNFEQREILIHINRRGLLLVENIVISEKEWFFIAGWRMPCLVLPLKFTFYPIECLHT